MTQKLVKQTTGTYNVISHVLKESLYIANTAKYPILCTVSSDNIPESRPVAVFQSTNSNKLTHLDYILFNTSIFSRKVKQMKLNNNVSMTFLMKDKRIYITLNGNAIKLNNKDKIKYWYEKSDRLWYPKGPNSNHYSVWRVNIKSLTIYSNKLKYLFTSNHKFAQDTLTSTPVIMKKDINNKWYITHPTK